MTPDRADDYLFDGDLGPFTLDDDADPALPNQRTWADIPSGLYTVTRPQIAPWIPTGLVCDGVNVAQLIAGKVTIYLHPDEHITCTFADAGPRPDAMVALTTAGPYKKDNLYQLAPTTKQAVRRNGVGVGKAYEYPFGSRTTAFVPTRSSSKAPGPARAPSRQRTS